MTGLATGAQGLWGGNPGLRNSIGMALGVGLSADVTFSAAPVNPNPVPVFSLDFTGSSVPSQVTFSRGTTATLMGQNRLIQYAPANLLLWSNDLSNVAWANDTGTVSANAGIAPDGTNTAQLMTGTATLFRFYQLVTTQNGPNYTMSVYAKQGTSATLNIGFINVNAGPTFTFATGTWSTLANWTTTATNVGNGWWRLTATRACTSVSAGPGWAVGGAGQTVYLWGGQFELGSAASTYNPTTTTAYYGPRIDYDPTTLVAQNFFQQSDNLASSWWTASNGSATANATVGPNGVANAVLLTEDTSSLAHQMASAFAQTANLTYVISVYAKANSAGRYLTITGGGISSAGEWPVWDLFGGTAAQTGATTIVKSVSIASAGNGWYRCSARVVPTNASAFVFALANSTVAGTSPSYAGNGTSGLYLWGAQLNEGAAALPYTATTTAAITQCAPLGLLVEEARTNLILQSEAFSDAAWSPTQATISANVVVAPDGNTTADKLVESAAAGVSHLVNPAVALTVVNTTSYTATVYAKAAERTWLYMLPSFSPGSAYFDLANGVLGTVTSATASMQYVGNGWYRCSVTVTSAATTGFLFVQLASANGTNTYNGDGTSGLYLWGAQLELGAFATSYIPTAAAAVTRNADNATITPGAWYNQPSGTIVAVADTTNIVGIGAIWNSSTVASPGMFVNSNLVNATLTSVFTLTGVTTVSKNTQFKSAYAYLASNHNTATNGGTVANSANATVVAAPVTIGIGSTSGTIQFLNGHINSLSYYNTALTNSQLQALTAPFIPASSFSLSFAGSMPSGVTFSRGTAATLMGQNRLIQYAPANLFQISNAFNGSNPGWSFNGNSTASSNNLDPFGGLTASKIQVDATTTNRYVNNLPFPVVIAGAPYTFSIYAQAAGWRYLNMGAQAQSGGVQFDLQTGTVVRGVSGGSTTYISSSITAVGNGFYRCSLTFSYATTGPAIIFSPSNVSWASGNIDQITTGDNVSGTIVYGAQLEIGTNLGTYNATTGTAYYGPRIDYDPTTLVAQNAVLQSGDFSSATWIKSSATVGTGIAGPLGFGTGYPIIEDTSTAAHRAQQIVGTIGSVTTWTYSVYAKQGGRKRILLRENASTGRAVSFDLNAGTVVDATSNPGGSASITPVGGGWYRCSMTNVGLTVGVTYATAIYLLQDTGALFADVIYTGDGVSGAYYWGAQLESFATLGSYNPTTTLQYAQCAPLGLLVEEARTNQLLNSSDYTNASWAKTNVVAAVSAVLSPDGTAAQSLTATAAVATNMIVNTPLVASGTSYTYSVYMRAGTGSTVGNSVLLRNNTTATNLLGVTIDLGTGVLTYTVGATGATSTYVGNGWWRITLSVSAGITATDGLITYIGWTGGAAAAGDFVYAWGAQLEAGAFATSYIPTAAAAVTRNADVASITSMPWFNASQGTFATRSIANTSAASPAELVLIGTTSNGFNANGAGISRWWNGTTNISSSSSATNGGVLSQALAYTASTRSICAEGGAVVSDANIPFNTTPTGLYIGSNGTSQFINSHIKTITYYNVKFTNTQLGYITT